MSFTGITGNGYDPQAQLDVRRREQDSLDLRLRRPDGTRRLKTFKTRKEADAWLVQARHQVAAGTFTADSASITVASAADLWLERCERDGLERSTMTGYGRSCGATSGRCIGAN